MTTYRRKARRGRNKPYTIHEPDTATLLQWLQCYKFMAKNPRLWFKNMHVSQQELKQVYEAGLPHIAMELGYIRPLKANSKPMIVTHTHYQDTAAIAA